MLIPGVCGGHHVCCHLTFTIHIIDCVAVHVGRTGLPTGSLIADEVEGVLNGIDVNMQLGIRNRAVIKTLYSIGLRVGELVNLDVYDLEIDRSVLTTPPVIGGLIWKHLAGTQMDTGTGLQSAVFQLVLFAAAVAGQVGCVDQQADKRPEVAVQIESGTAVSSRAQETATGLMSDDALFSVLQQPERCTAMMLFTASATAWKEERIEDAVFCLYAARLRVACDTERFPPLETGGDRPTVLFAALSGELTQRVIPLALTEDVAFRSAIERLAKWNLYYPDGYSPGYEYSSVNRELPGDASRNEHKAKLLIQLRALLTLLEDEDYRRAFRVANWWAYSDFDPPPSDDEMREALRTMRSITDERGLPMGSSMENQAAEVKSRE